MPTKNRVTITAQLHPVEDADLIEWVKSVPLNHRNRAIKAMLKAALMDGVAYDPTPPAPTPPPVDMSRIEELEARIAQQSGKLAQLDQLINELNKYDENLPARINQLVQRAMGNTAAAPPAQEAEVTPRVDEETLQQRKANRKKASW